MERMTNLDFEKGVAYERIRSEKRMKTIFAWACLVAAIIGPFSKVSITAKIMASTTFLLLSIGNFWLAKGYKKQLKEMEIKDED